MQDAVDYVRRIRVSDASYIPEFILHYLAEISDDDHWANAGTKHLAERFHLPMAKVDKALGTLSAQGLITITAGWCPDRGGLVVLSAQLHGPWDDYNGSDVPFVEYTNMDHELPQWATKMWRGRTS